MFITSSQLDVIYKDVYKNLKKKRRKNPGKHLCLSLLLIKLHTYLQPVTLSKLDSSTSMLLLIFSKLLKTNNLWNNCKWLLLHLLSRLNMWSRAYSRTWEGCNFSEKGNLKSKEGNTREKQGKYGEKHTKDRKLFNTF